LRHFIDDSEIDPAFLYRQPTIGEDVYPEELELSHISTEQDSHKLIINNLPISTTKWILKMELLCNDAFESELTDIEEIVWKNWKQCIDVNPKYCKSVLDIRNMTVTFGTYSDCLVRHIRICTISFSGIECLINVETKKALISLECVHEMSKYKNLAILWIEFYDEDETLAPKIGYIIKHTTPFIELTKIQSDEEIVIIELIIF